MRHRWIALFLAAGLLLLDGCRRGPANYAADGAEALEGKPFPAFVLPSVPGADSIRSSSLTGKPALVVFWATWCPGCLEEMEVLKGMKNDTTLAKASVALLSVDDPPAGALLSLRRLAIPYPVALGATPLLAALQLNSIPQSFVLDPKGTVVRAFTGSIPPEVLLQTLRDAGAR
jgi:cytochrome c biogenesis protein CcmG/thiol:disulfide interchange protein DsbE